MIKKIEAKYRRTNISMMDVLCVVGEGELTENAGQFILCVGLVFFCPRCICD